MPHITVSGCNMNMQIQYINIHAEVNFARETFNSPKAEIKLDEIKDKIEALLSEYFESIESDTMSNHEYNKMMQT